jgi:hypothetical protein
MEEVQKPSNSECYTPSSNPFKIYNIYLSYETVCWMLFTNLLLSTDQLKWDYKHKTKPTNVILVNRHEENNIIVNIKCIGFEIGLSKNYIFRMGNAT